MSIRFAAGARTPSYRMTGWHARQVARLAAREVANDNLLHQVRAEVLHAALRHFAAHGLVAAQVAGDRAMEVLTQGDHAGYDWWLDICRTLDRRLAARIEQQAKVG